MEALKKYQAVKGEGERGGYDKNVNSLFHSVLALLSHN